MSRREKEKKASLDALAKIAYSAGAAPPPAPPKPATRAPVPAPRPKPAPPPATTASAAARAAREKQIEERRDKLAEENALRKRRANELARSSNLQWRGSGFTDIPASIRRTGFDRVEPTVSQKIHDVLGDTREKEGRAKARDKGKRSGGRG